MQRRVLDPLGMKSSSFTPTAAVKKNLADAVMWTYHGREFPAPTFELGMPPAGCMYSHRPRPREVPVVPVRGRQARRQTTAEARDRSRRCSGRSSRRPKANAASASASSSATGKGRSAIGHGGAIYGFATEFAALPDEKLGVDRGLLARRGRTPSCSADRRRRAAAHARGEGRQAAAEDRDERAADPRRGPRTLAGRYRDGDTLARPRRDRSAALYHGAPIAAEVACPAPQVAATDLIVDDVQQWGTKIDPRRRQAHARQDDLREGEAERSTPPPEPPAKWKGLIGEYGWDHNTLYIFEKDGKLYALIELTEIDPLTEESENVFAFPAGPRHVPRREARLHPRRDRPGDEGRGREGRLRAPQDRRRERRDVQDQAAAAARRTAQGRAGREAAGGEGRVPEARPGRSRDDRRHQVRHPLRDRQQLPRHAVLHVGEGVHAEAGGGSARHASTRS